MDIFDFNTASFASFLLTFIRVSLIVFLLPFFGGQTIPNQVKAMVTLVLTIAIWPGISIPGELLPTHPMNIAIMVTGELLLGLLMGLMVDFVFAGIQTGGQIIGFQMGFSMISIADPTNGNQLVITSFLAQNVAMAVFLVMDGHLVILHALIGSFELVQPGHIFLGDYNLSDMIKLSGSMFVLAIKIAGPIVACLFMVDLALALMARAAPQMNLLIIGFPIKIGVGMFFMGIMFSLIAIKMDDTVRSLMPMFNNFMRAIGTEAG